MRAKKLISLVLGMALVFALACPAFAAGMQPRYVGDGKVWAGIEGNTFYAVGESTTGTTRIEVSATLNERGWFGSYQAVSSCSNASNGRTCRASGTYPMQNGKTYRVDYTVTIYYNNGTSETISGST